MIQRHRKLSHSGQTIPKNKSTKLLESHYAIRIFQIKSGIQTIFDPRAKEA